MRDRRLLALAKAYTHARLLPVSSSQLGLPVDVCTFFVVGQKTVDDVNTVASTVPVRLPDIIRIFVPRDNTWRIFCLNKLLARMNFRTATKRPWTIGRGLPSEGSRSRRPSRGRDAEFQPVVRSQEQLGCSCGAWSTARTQNQALKAIEGRCHI